MTNHNESEHEVDKDNSSSFTATNDQPEPVVDSSENQLDSVEDIETPIDDDMFYGVDTLLKRRKRNRKWEYLVKWTNFPLSQASWEPAENITPDLITRFRLQSINEQSAEK